MSTTKKSSVKKTGKIGLKTIISDIKKITTSLNNQIEKITRNSNKQSEKLFKQALKVLFKEYPELSCFSWHQYTPYWNDGDECTFSASTDYLTLKIDGKNYEDKSTYQFDELLSKLKNKDKEQKRIEKELEDAKKEKSGDNKWKIERLQDELSELNDNIEEVERNRDIIANISSLLDCFNQEFFKDSFGDHVTVLVTRDGIETDAYEHE